MTSSKVRRYVPEEEFRLNSLLTATWENGGQGQAQVVSFHSGVSRVDGNKKGLLTRQRQPKAAARLLRQRYLAIAQGRELCWDTTIYGFTDSCPKD